MNYLKSLPRWMQIQEIILLGFIILYAVGILTGGLFTSFYGTIALGIVSTITTLISLIKKQFLLSLINFAIGVGGFLLYISLPV